MTELRLTHRLAGRSDLEALRALMNAAISELQKPFLDERQIASSRTIMGLDTQLIGDGIYFIVNDHAQAIVAKSGRRRIPTRRGRSSDVQSWPHFTVR